MIEHTAERTEDGRVCVTSSSGFTAGTTMVLSCTFEQYSEGMKRYREGKLMQHAFSFLSAGECEYLISGLNEAEWEELFKEQY